LGFGGRRQRTRTRYRIHRGTIEELSHGATRLQMVLDAGGILSLARWR